MSSIFYKNLFTNAKFILKETGDGSLSPFIFSAISRVTKRRQRTVPCLLFLYFVAAVGQYVEDYGLDDQGCRHYDRRDKDSAS